MKLVIDAPPIDNYVDKLQIVMASGDLPDLIYNGGTAGNGANANHYSLMKECFLEKI